MQVLLDDGVYEFSYMEAGHESCWVCSRERIKISEQSKIFSPANLRASKELTGYRALIDYYMDCECRQTTHARLPVRVWCDVKKKHARFPQASIPFATRAGWCLTRTSL